MTARRDGLILRRLRACLIGVLVAGCSGDKSPHETSTPAGTPGGTSTDSGTVTGATTGSTTTDPVDVLGIVVDPSGLPIATEDVLCCTPTTCIQEESLTDGSFAFDLEPGSQVSIKTHADLFRLPRWAAALVPVAVPASGGVNLGELYVPDLPSGTRFEDASQDPQVLLAGDGLVLTLNRADLVPEVGVVLNDLAARRLPDERVPTYPGIADRTVEGVWALHPFGTVSTSPIALRAPTDVPAGNDLSFWVIDHLGGTLLGPIAGTSDGAFATTDPGQGIELITYVVVTVP